MPTILFLVFAFLILPHSILAQTASEVPPDFMVNIKTQAEYDNLSPVKKKEIEEFSKRNPEILMPITSTQVITKQNTANCSAQEGDSCTATNICSMSTGGFIQCNGTCSAVPPSESLCPQPSDCGNGICESAGIPAETPITCPSDCKVKVRQF